MTAYSMQKPKDWQAFERAICVLVRLVLEDPNAQPIGRQGQAQHGVDIFGTRKADAKRVGVQCKRRFDSAVTEKELRKELEKAKQFKPPLDEFIVATTAPRDAKIQTCARQLTEELKNSERSITVVVWGWDDIEERASKFVEAQKAFDPTYSPYAENLDRKFDSLVTTQRPKAHSADERLLAKFRTLASEAALGFLRTHDFGSPVPSSVLEPFETIGASWRGAEYEFVEPEVQKAFEQVVPAARKLGNLTATHLFLMSNPDMRTVKTDRDQRTGKRSQDTLDAAAEMNAAANDLSNAIDAFLRIAREKIPV